MSGTHDTSFAARQRAKGWFGAANGWASEHLWGGTRTLWIALVLVALAGVLYVLQPAPQLAGGAGRGGAGGRGGPGGGTPTPVGVATAKLSDVKVTLNALGTVNPTATATVKPLGNASGLLLSINFQEGQMVKKGEVLAQIDPRTIQNTLDQAKATLARDEATYANGQLDLARQQSLFAANATSQQALNLQATTVKTQAAAVQSDRASVAQQELNLSYTKITSPIDGRAGLKQVDVGNLVSSSTSIVVVTQMDPITVLFSLPEDNISTLNQRLAQGETVSVDAYDRTQAKILATGKLSAADNVIDTATGTFKLRATFSNGDGVLYPNQFVNVKLIVNTIPNQTVIPSAAVQLGASGKYVFVVGADNTASMRTVTTGVTDGDNVAITDGLKVGETVVTDGSDRLRDGTTVSIPDPKAQAAAAQGNAAVAASGGPAQGVGGGAGGPGGRRGQGGQGGSNAQNQARRDVMQRMTDKERADFRAITDRAEQNAKIRAYSQDAKFMARKPNPNAFGGGRGGPGGGGGGGFGGGPGGGGGGGFGGGGRGG